MMRITPVEIKNEKSAYDLLVSLGVSSEGIRILSPKTINLAFKIETIKSWEANIIKQHALSLGSDAAIERAALVKDITTGVLVFGSKNQLEKLAQKLKNQPFVLDQISKKIKEYLKTFYKEKFTFKARGKTLKINAPLCCGIINLTNDSFSGDGLLSKASLSDKLTEIALARAAQMVKEGANMLDIGAESSKPFSKGVKDHEQIKRVVPVLRAVRKEFKKIPISIDTYKYKVAKAAVDEGADIINDITALRKHPNIIGLIKKYNLGCILMHMKGNPENMQVNPGYDDLFGELVDFFQERLEFCYKKGLGPQQLLIDPGIGFGKRPEDNYKIIKELYKLKIFGVGIFLGLSRKSFIGKILNVEADKRLAGSLAANVLALINGAKILRVHDVKETKELIKVVTKINNS